VDIEQTSRKPAKEQIMNELSEWDVEVFEHIGDTHAELDPVPEDVLAAARGALGLGLPTLPFGAATS
jgi:hypothetical protein